MNTPLSRAVISDSYETICRIRPHTPAYGGTVEIDASEDVFMILPSNSLSPMLTSQAIFKIFNIRSASLLLTGIGFAFNILPIESAQAQALSAPVLPSPVAPPKGQTVNLSLQSGSKSNLSFGTNTSFGASLNTQLTPGMTVTSVSNFAPLEASISSTIGAGSTPGKTTATISNLRAEGNGSTTIGGAPINATSGNFASGNAVLEGLGANVILKLDPKLSEFKVETAPNVIGSAACSPSTGVCKYTTDDGKKPYPELQVSSGSANASLNTNTTVDIGSNQFSSSFAQSF